MGTKEKEGLVKYTFFILKGEPKKNISALKQTFLYPPPFFFFQITHLNPLYIFLMSTEARLCRAILLEDFGIFTAVSFFFQ